ncbi:DUF6642 family protein [Prosthecobacter sp.]|uniref:DUF6642 family protein n=1 Tax=Prosthecobacter sp. TaxID=1965333 RepID=UPI002ABB0F4A|nr:DUF6642 family protein [Prosthecobacter sp.]MDZ4403617.1 DUF6642 family protein [Prosthecobacter sp.]
MPRVPLYLKNIVCLEALWTEELENRLSVLPILELTARTTSAKFIYLTCNTKAELRHNLSLVSRKKSYGILVLAFHGDPGKIELAKHVVVSLDSLATMMGRKFAGWVVHFASCSTVQADEERLARFVTETQVALVTGFTQTLDWTEGAVMDLLLLRWLQDYRDLNAFWKHLQKRYPDLIETTGMTAFPLALATQTKSQPQPNARGRGSRRKTSAPG